MSVSNGQLANATTFNGAFLSRTVNTSTVGTVTLNNTSDINSGAQITNLQRAVNEIFNAVGMTGEGDASRNDYSSNNYVSNGSSRKIAIGQLDAAFDTSTGHDHDGINSKALSAENLAGLNYYRAEWIELSLVLTSQIESFNFIGNTGSQYDVSGPGLSIILANNIGYAWLNVTDGANIQTDPGGVGTAVQVDILSADTGDDIANKIKTEIDLAALSGIDSTSVTIADLQITYDAGDATPDGNGNDTFCIFTLLQNGIGAGPASGTSTDVSSVFLGQTPSGSSINAGVVTDAPNNRVEIRNYESQTFIEDAEGQKVYGRLTESAGVWTLSYYTLEAGVETAHNLSSQNITIYYREVFTLATVPTFGVDAGVLGTLDLTNDIVYATETIAGKVLLSNVVATSIGSTNVKGVSTRVAKADHAHQGIHAVQEFSEAVDVYGDIVLKGSGGTTITRTGQTFEISSVGEPEVEYRTISGPEATAKALTLNSTPLTASKTILDVQGAPPQFYTDDYTVSADVLSWTGLGLDGVLTAGDKVRIIYWI